MEIAFYIDIKILCSQHQSYSAAPAHAQKLVPVVCGVPQKGAVPPDCKILAPCVVLTSQLFSVQVHNAGFSCFSGGFCTFSLDK